MGQEDPLEQELAAHSSMLAGKISRDRGAWHSMFPWDCKESGMTAMTQPAHALCDSAIPFLGIYQKKTKTLIQKYVCTQMFTAALFPIMKIYRNNLSFHSYEWIQKIYICVSVCVCVYSGILLSIKENKISPVGTWQMIDLEDIALSKMSDREIQILYAFNFYMKSKKQNK